MRKVQAFCALAFMGLAPGQPAGNWRADFSKRSTELSEPRSGGPGKDGIPALANPKFGAVARAAEAGVRIDPAQILIWHELGNDEIAGVPILVSYCPLCNSSIVFDRRMDGKVLSFRAQRRSFIDEQTGSTWNLLEDCVEGPYAGKQLKRLSHVVAFAFAWIVFHPGTEIVRPSQGGSQA